MTIRPHNIKQDSHDNIHAHNDARCSPLLLRYSCDLKKKKAEGLSDQLEVGLTGLSSTHNYLAHGGPGVRRRTYNKEQGNVQQQFNWRFLFLFLMEFF